VKETDIDHNALKCYKFLIA